MAIAIYQAGLAIFGVGSDLESAVEEANKWLYKPISVDDIETRYSDGFFGDIYWARISDALASLVSEKGGEVDYVRIAEENILVTREEYVTLSSEWLVK